jgi:hypothetical protein
MLLKLTRALSRAVFLPHSNERYFALSTLANFVYPNFCHTERAKTFLHDQAFLDDYRRFERNPHSIDRKWAVIQFLKLVDNLAGDTVECGAFQGGTSFFILKHGRRDRAHHIFDSFEGLSAPDAIDGAYWNKGSLSSAESVIRENLKSFSNVQYYRGWIPDRFPEVADRRFCFVHVDVDLYRPTKDSLEFFFARLMPGGVIICDDYGFDTCPGARKAMDEFAAEQGLVVLDLPTGQGIIINR